MQTVPQKSKIHQHHWPIRTGISETLSGLLNDWLAVVTRAGLGSSANLIETKQNTDVNRVNRDNRTVNESRM